MTKETRKYYRSMTDYKIVLVRKRSLHFIVWENENSHYTEERILATVKMGRECWGVVV